jgi:hypothetical protein
MKRIKLFEDFQKSKFSIEEIRKCIIKGGVIYATIINTFPDNDPEEPLEPLSIDDDGDISVNIDGQEHIVKLKNVDKIDYQSNEN